MQTTKQNPDQPGHLPEMNIHLGALPERVLISIKSLTSVFDSLQHYLTEPSSATDGYSITKEVRADAAVTFSFACSRLNKVLDTEKNWDVTTFDQKLLASTDALNKANEDLAQLRLKAAQHAIRPSVLLNATLRRTPEGRIIAYLGDSPDASLAIGLGDSVFEALDNLDRELTKTKKDHHG